MHVRGMLKMHAWARNIYYIMINIYQKEVVYFEMMYYISTVILRCEAAAMMRIYLLLD